WQHPYVNIFKHVRVEDWKRSAKEGEVSTCTDKRLKCSVFRIRGPVPANSFIMIPKNINQSLGLTGRFFYLLFRPTPGKYFVVHLDEGQVVRISFSNMFKEFKSTATWLQFPFLCGAAKDSVYESTAKSARHGLVGPAPTSVRWTCLTLDLQYTLSVYLNRCYSQLKSIKLCANMAVKNMFTSNLLLDPGLSFSEAKLMGLVSSEGTGPVPRDMSFPVPKGGSWHDLYDHIRFPSEGTKLPFDSIQKDPPRPEASRVSDQRRPIREEPCFVSLSKPIPRNQPPMVVTEIPELGLVSTHHSDDSLGQNTDQHQQETTSSEQFTSRPFWDTDDGGIHVHLHPEDGFSQHGEESEQEVVCTPVPRPVHLSSSNESRQQALWSKSGDEVVYPCHSIIVSMKISSNQQRFFIGHTDKMVVVWNTMNVSKGGEVSIIAKAHTDVDIHTMKVAFFDDTRMVSCGRDNIRLWRVRNGTLRSCPVNLAEYHSLDFTDVAFEEGNSFHQHLDDRTLFASSRSGYIFEIDYSRVVVRNVRRLISVSSSFCATGSEDGFLRLWPLDFSAVFLEAEHEGPVSLVSVSSDSLQVLAATSTGNLGFLDVSSRGYNTLMRSHTDTVLGFSVDGIRRHLTSASSDGTVRIWNMDSLHQLYDFASEDSPCSVAFHPSEQVFSCGFSSGIVRVFDISAAKLLAEHKKAFRRCPSRESVMTAFILMFFLFSFFTTIKYRQHRGNVVARGTEHAPDALAVSSDSRCLAFIGPSEYIITIADSRSLDEYFGRAEPRLDSALRVCFSPASTEHLLVATSSNKILWVSTKTGRLLREVSKVHKHQCSSLAVSEDSRFLLTAGHNAVKVWDYNMQLHMFIGHSQPIRQVGFTPDQLGVVSVGDAIFLWDFLALPVDSLTDSRISETLCPHSQFTSVQPHTEVNGVRLSNGMPRRTAPLPSSPPPRLDISTLDQVDQGVLGSLSICDDPPTASVADPSSDPRPPSSFLRVTELTHTSPLNSSLTDAVELKGKKPVRPDCYRHFIPRFKTSTLDQVESTLYNDSSDWMYWFVCCPVLMSSLIQAAVAPQEGEEGIKLKAVIGYNGNGRSNMVWSLTEEWISVAGLFAYSCGCVVVVEYLHTGSQRHLQGHSEEISCLAVTHDAQTVASAAGGSNGSRSLICIWDVQNGTCRSTISYHRGAVQSLAFSRDDRFFLSVGDFSEPEVALWSSKTFQLLSSVSVSGPLHDAAFSPSAAGQLACVGRQGAFFCLIHTQGSDVDLKVQRVKAPSEVGEVELTALCYHTDSFLFTATNRGHVCVWDVNTQRCFMTWEADEGEIGVLLCRGNHLLTGSNTRWLRLWEVEAVRGVKPQEKVCSGEDSGTSVVLEQEIMLDGTTVSAAFDTSMDMGIVGTTAGTLWYINWSDCSSIRLVSGHKTQVNDVVFSSDERHFATCSEDGSVRVWSAPSNELVVQFQVLNQACGCVCWSPSSSTECVAGGYSDGTLRIFRVSSSEMEMKLHPHQVAVTAIQYSADGENLLPMNGATIRIIRDHKGAPITTIQCVSEQCKTLELEGKEMWLAASADRRVSVWAADWLNDKCDLLDWLTFPAPAYIGDDSPPPSLAAFCPADPGLLVYTGYGVEKELSFYSLAKKQIIKTIALPDWATCLSLSCHSQLIAVGSKGRVLKLIKSSSGRFQDFLQHSDSLQTCRFSPSGKLLFTVAHNEILLWEVQDL
ncbi:hypothetical protein F7725_014150, partial [Dissostichus mawsoni]